MKIYTKTGDDGTTGLLGGDRIAKNSLRIAAIGDVDEVNAHLGAVRAAGLPQNVDEEIARLQSWLFDLGAELAAPVGGKFDRASIGDRHVEWLETAIDRHMAALPPLRAFILPGGAMPAALLHLARAACRRAERAVLDLALEEPVRAAARTFINRLSDYLFAAARTVNAAAGIADVEWHSHQD